MKQLVLLLIVALAAVSPAAAQPAPDFTVQVVVDSAFLRAAPGDDAPAAGSAVQNDVLVAVGRSADGVWLQVRRPGARTPSGWIFRRLVLFTFEVARLPITDLETGVTGPTAVVDTGFAVITIGEVVVRSAPDQAAPERAVIPVNRTIPVLERTPDRQWLRVNYLGTTGWIAEYLTRTSANLDAVPVSADFAADPRYAALPTVPREAQIAQADRLLAYLSPMIVSADAVAAYWRGMARGDTLECLPPGDFTYFEMTPADVAELPELRRQERLLTQAVDDLNASLVIMRRCGVYINRDISAAYSSAVSAANLFRLVTARIENTRDLLLGLP